MRSVHVGMNTVVFWGCYISFLTIAEDTKTSTFVQMEYLKSEGPGEWSVSENMYENGNKVGSMG